MNYEWMHSTLFQFFPKFVLTSYGNMWRFSIEYINILENHSVFFLMNLFYANVSKRFKFFIRAELTQYGRSQWFVLSQTTCSNFDPNSTALMMNLNYLKRQHHKFILKKYWLRQKFLHFALYVIYLKLGTNFDSFFQFHLWIFKKTSALFWPSTKYVSSFFCIPLLLSLFFSFFFVQKF